MVEICPAAENRREIAAREKIRRDIFSRNLPARIAVILTTPDYIDYLYRASPRRFVFVTAKTLRDAAREIAPTADSEIRIEHFSAAELFNSLTAHAAQYHYQIAGVVAYDCEVLIFAAQIAARLGLPYASPVAITLARSKQLSKDRWRACGVRCPQSQIVADEKSLAPILENFPAGTVLKPTSGAGSELTLFAPDLPAARAAYRLIADGLNARRDQALFAEAGIVAEEFIGGEEFSADFIFTAGQAEIIRVTKKLKYQFGITGAYQLFDWQNAEKVLPPAAARGFKQLPEKFARAANALELNRAVVMVDFFMDAREPVFLEMTPRPGGDCLPRLLRAALDFDILTFAADFADFSQENPPPHFPAAKLNAVGLQVFAERAGIFRAVDWEKIRADSRVLSFYQKRQTGDRVQLPPTDWNTWNVGDLTYRPREFSAAAIAAENRELLAALTIRWTEK